MSENKVLGYSVSTVLQTKDSVKARSYKEFGLDASKAMSYLLWLGDIVKTHVYLSTEDDPYGDDNVRVYFSNGLIGTLIVERDYEER